MKILFFVLITLLHPICAQNWIGTSGNWEDAANWNTNSIPVSGATVLINGTGIVITAANAVNVNTLTVDGITVTLVFQNDVQLNSLVVLGYDVVLNPQTKLNITSNFTWTAIDGRILGSSNLTATLNILSTCRASAGGEGIFIVENITVNNYGYLNYLAAGFGWRLGSSSQVQNYGTWDITVSGSVIMFYWETDGSFINYGTLNIGANTAFIPYITFYNYGLLNVTGSIFFEKGSTNKVRVISGTINMVTSNSFIQFNGGSYNVTQDALFQDSFKVIVSGSSSVTVYTSTWPRYWVSNGGSVTFYYTYISGSAPLTLKGSTYFAKSAVIQNLVLNNAQMGTSGPGSQVNITTSFLMVDGATLTGSLSYQDAVINLLSTCTTTVNSTSNFQNIWRLPLRNYGMIEYAPGGEGWKLESSTALYNYGTIHVAGQRNLSPLSTYSSGFLANYGIISLDPNALLNVACYFGIDTGGSIQLNQATFQTSSINLVNGEIIGSGTVNSNVFHQSGTIRPGGNGIGSIQINGVYYQQMSDAMVVIDANATSYDTLVVSTAVTLLGSVQVKLASGYFPVSATLTGVIKATYSISGNQTLIPPDYYNGTFTVANLGLNVNLEWNGTTPVTTTTSTSSSTSSSTGSTGAASTTDAASSTGQDTTTSSTTTSTGGSGSTDAASTTDAVSSTGQDTTTSSTSSTGGGVVSTDAASSTGQDTTTSSSTNAPTSNSNTSTTDDSSSSRQSNSSSKHTALWKLFLVSFIIFVLFP